MKADNFLFGHLLWVKVKSSHSGCPVIRMDLDTKTVLTGYCDGDVVILFSWVIMHWRQLEIATLYPLFCYTVSD